MWRRHISIKFSSVPCHRPPQDLDLNFAGLGEWLNKFLLRFPVEILSIAFSASELSLLFNTHKKIYDYFSGTHLEYMISLSKQGSL